LEDPFAPVSSDVGAVYESALSSLSRAGAKLERGWPPGLDLQAQFRTYQYLLFALLNADSTPDQRQAARLRFEKDPNDLAAAAIVERHARWLGETQRRLAFRAVWQKYFESYDVFLLPAGFTAAFPHDHSQPIEARVIETPEGKRSYWGFLYWICAATLAGLPATAAPVGRTRAGLPVGIQIVAPMWEDATSIEFAALMADTLGRFTPPPGF
jgi:hypothetical protein